MIINRFLLMLLLALTLHAYSQNSNPLDERFTPPPTSIFAGKGKNDGGLNSSSSFTVLSHAIKISTLELSRGEFGLLYEQKLIKNITIEAGIGICFAENYVNQINSMIMGGLWNEEFYDKDYFLYNVLPLRKMLVDGSFSSGYLYSIAVRNYFSTFNNSSMFLDLVFKKANQEFFLGGKGYKNSSFSYKNTYVTLNLGYSWKSAIPKVVFIHNIGFGLGVKFSKWDLFMPINPNYYPFVYEKKDQLKTGINPIVSLKYNLGFCF